MLDIFKSEKKLISLKKCVMNCDEKRSKKKKNPINVQKYYNGQPCSLPMNSNRIFWERKGGRNRMFMAIVELSAFSNSVYLTTSAYAYII